MRVLFTIIEEFKVRMPIGEYSLPAYTGGAEPQEGEDAR